jgi:sulfate adenylyltransferase subunit 1 (EFTu-like GTPase family)
MATGASTADVAIVLVDARKGVLPQSRSHAYITALLGVRHVGLAYRIKARAGAQPH